MEQEDFSKYNGEGTTLRKAQLRMLEMLVEIDKIARRHNISYWLDSGTLLGAVRHGGFIPWDDDIDICILRDDYKKFRNFLIEELPEQLIVEDTSTDKYYFDISPRIKDKKSYIDYPLFAKQKSQGLWVDILLMERIPSMRLKSVIDFFYGKVFREIHHLGDAQQRLIVRRWFSKIMAYLCYPVFSVLVAVIRFLTPKCINKIGHTYGVAYKSLRWGNEIFPCKTILFENKLLLGPHNVDAYLKNIYNDYMQMPPVEKREIHTTHIEIYEDGRSK